MVVLPKDLLQGLSVKAGRLGKTILVCCNNRIHFGNSRISSRFVFQFRRINKDRVGDL